MMDRRNFILGLGSLSLAAGPALSETGDVALKDLATRKGLLYGTAINLHTVINDLPLAKLITRECNVIVPEWEMKWKATQPAT
ncbi:MAG: endo-1,4-beta-xylanase, partial [Rhizomicrobium sp.]